MHVAAAISDPQTLAGERAWLERLRRRYHRRRLVHPDPLEFLYGHHDVRDRELVGLLASALAYGNVKAMLPAIHRALEAVGDGPAARLRGLAERTLARRLRAFRYRFTTGPQLAGMLAGAARVQRTHGSIDRCLAAHARDGDETAMPALGGFVAELRAGTSQPLSHLVPHPDGGSACKRLNLYLRWMVRCDAVDPGGWSCLRPRQLVVPLDTHVFRTARDRGWTRRRTPDAAAAVEVTAVLRAIRPDDPLRYDFALTRPGIRGDGDRPAAAEPPRGPDPAARPVAPFAPAAPVAREPGRS